MQVNTHDQPSIDALEIGEMTAAELEAISLVKLAEIIGWIERSRDDIRTYEVAVHQELQRRFQDRAAQVRSSQAKSTGTVRFAQGDFMVVAELPKRVDYDQVKLRAAVEALRLRDEDPNEYVAFEISVPEAKWHEFTPGIRTLFQDARTVKAGRQSFKLIRLRADEIPVPSNDSDFGAN